VGGADFALRGVKTGLFAEGLQRCFKMRREGFRRVPRG